MSEFDLDLQNAEEQLNEMVEDGGVVVLAILDGSTNPEEWIAEVQQGKVLVFSIEGDLNELAAGFARDIRDMGGELMHFRGFLIVTPPGVDIDTERLE